MLKMLNTMKIVAQKFGGLVEKQYFCGAVRNGYKNSTLPVMDRVLFFYLEW